MEARDRAGCGTANAFDFQHSQSEIAHGIIGVVLRLREKVIESFQFARLHSQHFASPDAKDKNRFGLEAA